MDSDSVRPLRVGDLVEVRSSSEILSTLDSNGSLDNVPFMPEMVAHLGGRFRVAHRAEKICDLVGPGGSRRMRDTVYLEDLRCSGAGHGGCQAECRFYWKEAWLKRVSGDDAMSGPVDDASVRELTEIATANTRPQGWDGKSDSFRCQATEALRATEPLRGSDPLQYVREVRSGNVSILRVLRVVARATWWKLGRRTGLRRDLPRPPTGTHAAEAERLDLKPGEWVEIRTAEEIVRTLDDRGTNRGLFVTPEVLSSCGRRARVRKRIERVISERDGEMLHLKNDCIMLEGVVCTGETAPGFWFCHREAYPFWREAWLKRVETLNPGQQ